VAQLDRDKVQLAAQKLVEKKRYDKAILEYQKIIAEDPKDARTLLKIGDLYLKMEQYVEAITTYERVGQFYSQTGFALKAIAVYKQIREIILKHVPHLEDRFGHIVPQLAEIYRGLGLTSDALAAYDEVATRLQKVGRDRDAIDVFKKVVDLDPQNPLPHLRLAEAYVRVKDVDGSIERFGTAAEILLRLGRQDDALKVVERLLQHRSEAKFARMAAEILVERGGPGDAMTALTKLQVCFKENPKDLDTLAVLARAFERLGQPTKAIAVQKEAARIAKETGQVDKFEALVEALVRRAPDDDGVRQLQAQRLAAQRSSSRPAGASQSSIPAVSSVEIDVDEDVDDADLVEGSVAPAPAPSAPFALQGAAGAGLEPDPAVRTRQLLQQAEQYRRGYAYEHAANVLATGLAEMPGNRELFDKLCDILIESGDQGAAVEHMLTFAHHLATTGDVDGSARLLDEVLLLEPDQPDALQMLANLGYAVPGGYDAGAEQQAYDYEQQAGYAAQPQGYADPNAGYDPQAYAAYAQQQAPQAGYADPGQAPYQSLPSYDLEEVSAVEALSLSQGQQLVPEGFVAGQLDDPFAGEAYAQDPYGQPVHEPPLPAFPIDEAAQAQAAYAAQLAAAGYAAAVQPQQAVFEDRPSQVGFAEPASNQLDEDALEEVEFFASHGMFEEARGLLESELARLPRHPLLLDRMRELEAMAAEAGVGLASEGAPEPPPEHGDDRSFDIAASLDMLDAIDAGPVAHAGHADADPHQVSVESVFEQFKAGVAAQVAESHAATHYDLGVAYQEMGLLHDAINEFHLAAREPERECVCQSMVGMIHLSLGDVDAAIDAFIRGLHASHRTIDQELALTYEIGNAYEAQGVTDQALYYFQRAAHIDPTYDDPRGSVTDRMRRLEPARAGAYAAGPVSAGFDGDDFSGLLDEKLP
jgi:tetratricopeptide (TPR) repeat protein